MEDPIRELKPDSFDNRIRIGSTARPDLASRVAKRQVVTTVISRSRLGLYERAGLASGFKVERIAGEGEEYPSIQGEDPAKQEVRDVKVVGEGYVAVSIKKPETAKPFTDYTPFWDDLRVLEQKQAPPKPTAKP